MYRHLRLWFWWNYTIKRNEFSNKLNFYAVYEKQRGSCKGDNGCVNMKLISYILMRQRDIAHNLDAGCKIKSFNPTYLKLAKI